MDGKCTWREVLSSLIQHPYERRRLAAALDVNPVTLTRWASNRSQPSARSLRVLIDLLPPEAQEELLAELSEEERSIRRGSAHRPLPLVIPSRFYAQVLHTLTTSAPPLRTPALFLLLLRQMVAQLDPSELGLSVLICPCVPPRAGEPVRSLRKTWGLATAPWSQLAEQNTVFFGAESQSEEALSKGRMVVVQHAEELARDYPSHLGPLMTSTLVAPLLQAETTAGSLALISTQPHFFTQERQELIQHYVHLFVLIFEPQDFYPLKQITLRMMPPYERQRPVLAGFQRRVLQLLYQEQQAGRALTRSWAERQVWQEIERDLLALALESTETGESQ